jgi:hypothetical protein
MSRYDKYSGVTGGFRAEAAAVADPAIFDQVRGVGLDANGRAVLGAPSNSGFKGVTIVDRTKRRAGDILDVMTHGEIVDLDGLAAGTTYYLQGDGTLGAAETRYHVGHTVEAWRLVVRFSDQGAA